MSEEKIKELEERVRILEEEKRKQKIRKKVKQLHTVKNITKGDDNDDMGLGFLNYIIIACVIIAVIAFIIMVVLP